MLSDFDLRYVMETAFIPTLCKCTIVDGMMTLELVHPKTLEVEFEVAGIEVAELGTGRAIAALVLKIREQARLLHLAQAQPLRRQG